MSTLLLRLDGPMQAWGTDSRFGVRDTRREPTKSGVVGLIASALGRARSEPIDDLAALTFGVRVDRQGQVLRDFHTAGADGFYRASGAVERKNVIVSDRFYLADACFTAGFESEDTALLRAIRDALLSPVWPPFLGRRAFPPAAPLVLGLVDASLLDALRAAPLPPPTLEGRRSHEQGDLRFVLDIAAADGPRALGGADVPLSFESARRRHRTRETVTVYCPPIP